LNAFVLKVLGGTPIRKIKDSSGHLMTDAYLLEKASAEYPDIEDLYERGCGYIHLGEVHILHAAEVTGPLQMELTVSVEDHEITDTQRLSAIQAMTRVTDLVLKHVDGWVQTKASPDLVTNPLERAEWLLERGYVTRAKEWLKQVIANHGDPTIVTAAKAKLESLH
jgi:hypothetical protein